MTTPFDRSHYDVLIAGARCAGASLAMLLAREGRRVLVVDPKKRGSDTLSTHALMRGGVLQLHRWGLLDAIRDAGTPPIRSTTFHYGSEVIEVAIKPRDGVDALYAPRRTVLDPVLGKAAAAAGAEVVHGWSLGEVVRDENGGVRGAHLTAPTGQTREISADLVVGADGVNSRLARLVGAEPDYQAPHASTAIYGYWRDVPMEGNHWYYQVGAAVGTIPTNDGDTCVFASVPRDRFDRTRSEGLEVLHREALEEVSPELASTVAAAERTSRLRAFPGIPGFLRRSWGPGWALVGDAGYFKDPITAHGITDALIEADSLADQVLEGTPDGLRAYQESRDSRVRNLLDLTDRIASFEWDLEEAKILHLQLSRAMKEEVETLLALRNGGD